MNRSLSSVILDELGRAPDGLTPTELHDAVLARPEALENDNVYRLFRGHDGQDAARAALMLLHAGQHVVREGDRFRLPPSQLHLGRPPHRRASG